MNRRDVYGNLTAFVIAIVLAGASLVAHADETLNQIPSWTPGVTVQVGDLVQYDGTVYQVQQSHTTQSDWTPNIVPALFTVRPTAEVLGRKALVKWTPGVFYAAKA